MPEDNMLLGGGYSDYYAFTQFIFNNSIELSIIYETHLPEQEKDIIDNKRPYKDSRLASDTRLLSSSDFIKVENYQSITGHKAKSPVDDNKVDYNNSCLSTDNENN